MERATGTEVYGCGSPRSTDITLNIQTTTGGNFSISLNGKNTVEHLKKVVSKKLKVAKDRICLLHRERQLREGTLEENGLLDGARVILLPSVETGLLSQRPENSVMQALESLNENQVNDFLSGKSPLNLTMRLGDHMMLIQLQLSTLSSSSSSSSRSLRIPSTSKKSSSPAPETKSSGSSQHSGEAKKLDAASDNDPDKSMKEEQPLPVLQQQDLEILKNAFELYRSMTDEKFSDKLDSSDDKDDLMDTSNCTISDYSDTSIDIEQSPITSLSNLVSNPIHDNIKEALADSVKSSLLDLLTKGNTESVEDKQEYSHVSSHSSEGSDLSNDSDSYVDQSSFLTESTIDEYPMEHLFNSAVDKGLFEDQEDSVMDREISNLATTSHGTQDSTPQNSLPSFQKIAEPLKTKRFHYLLHKTSKFKHPNVQNKQKAFMQSVVNKHNKRMQNRQDTPSSSRTEPYMTNTRKLLLQPSTSDNEDTLMTDTLDIDDTPVPSTSKEVFKTPDTPKKTQCESPTPQVDTKDLIEASKNLTQKLKKLSKEVLTNKIDLRRAEEAVCSKTGPGAVIESMKHHGKGIYSGTFSGTLNPALQDRYGRPKRDISTIIHILNDLLCATPPIALTTKESKHACSTGSAATGKGKCLGCSQPSCSSGQCDGHQASTSNPDSPRKEADCGCAATSKPTKHLTPDSNGCPSCYAKSANGEECKKCDTAKILALENSKTKCKLEQLRLVMQQKKQRREARKMKTLPYNTPQKAICSPEPAAPMQEEIDTVA